ncbi:hypothetical protein RHMOL_Rhmol01G0378200 [Rhododendron molle]|uniref:Uncharacterized protein n=1 Tax=Rhododendron molle TaxID=49168 RepID=A0ACC0QBT6_RHOML|nr:hypothetical protein RHMOL_Rhmol01G0378200 [Rhododendron molle]
MLLVLQVKLSSFERIVLLNYSSKETKRIDFGITPSDYNLAGYGSEGEADEEAATVSLPSDLGRVNRASTKSAVKLQEIEPRMTLQLRKVQEGLCSGGIIFSEYGDYGKQKTKETEVEQNQEDEEVMVED